MSASSANHVISTFFGSGRELFLSNASLFVDDAEAYDKYQREPESNDDEQKVSFLCLSFFTSYAFSMEKMKWLCDIKSETCDI